MTDRMLNALKRIQSGHSTGESYPTCEAAERRGWVVGNWEMGYYLTPRGARALQREDDKIRERDSEAV